MSKILQIELLINKDAGLSNPSGICYDGMHNTLFITDMQNKRVIKYHNKVVEELPVMCNRDKLCLKKPLAIAYRSNKLHITDAAHHCIFKYAHEYWEEVNITNNMEKAINLPGSIASDFEGNIYVSDFLHNRICKINLKEEVSVLKEIKCSKPYGIYLHEGILYVTDTGHKQIVWFDVKTNGHGVTVRSDFTPIAITVDEDGDLYISEHRKIYLFHQRSRVLELILDNHKWRQFGYDKLCHIGALVSISNQEFVFSDTIKNSVYKVSINKFWE
ncbi:hypothetical protein HZI73_05990 [Vallitalea pronyensis]|uniref:SMP-30/Gluconolactonase/LRE-like region domain-containing protein n=1 Tax=Vallitalea pronyensis TaxID=1348613 RepID=A0A8J8MII7_9FIRM|nr:NHL repeat-containing protein [Vallitalea pronyensis]QUI21878.1 hypothetical protein HZI73_05990 [Vallitalea pronyensis]